MRQARARDFAAIPQTAGGGGGAGLLELGKERGRRPFEADGITHGACHEHGPLQSAHHHARLLARGCAQAKISLVLALIEQAREPYLVGRKEHLQRLLHRCRQRPVFRRGHAAQAHAVLGQHIRVQLHVRAQARGCACRGRVDLVQRARKGRRVTLDEPASQFRLGGEVIVQRGLGEPDLGGDVGVAEAVEAARLHEVLGDVENTLGRIRGLTGRGVHAHP